MLGQDQFTEPKAGQESSFNPVGLNRLGGIDKELEGSQFLGDVVGVAESRKILEPMGGRKKGS